jgi:hypothetical protein
MMVSGIAAARLQANSAGCLSHTGRWSAVVNNDSSMWQHCMQW